jgi:hypothetical protein
MIYFHDVDIVYKLANCGFLPLIAGLLGVDEAEFEARYLVSLRTRLDRPSKRLASQAHQASLAAFCKRHGTIGVAADIDRQEELLRGGMDPGEALLFAEAEATGGTVVTGDKRALAAYARLSTPEQRSRIRVVCWEQLLLRVREIHGYEALRDGCCSGSECDGMILLAFSNGLATPESEALECIQSYLKGVEVHSSDILCRF